jgi:hypothetical protein
VLLSDGEITRVFIVAAPVIGAAVRVRRATARAGFHRNTSEDVMRNKLKLNVDQLAVDSFKTSGTSKEKGTVLGHDCSCIGACGGDVAEVAATGCWMTACRPYVCCI